MGLGPTMATFAVKGFRSVPVVMSALHADGSGFKLQKNPALNFRFRY